MTDIDQLQVFVELLDATYRAAHASLAVDYPLQKPEEMRTADGRFILLDALAALVNARTALVVAGRVT